MILKNGWVFDGLNFFPEKKDIRVEEKTIKDIGKNITPLENEEIIDCKDKMILPGLTNTHTHVVMNLLKGYGEDKSFYEWLFKEISPREDKLSGKDFYWGALLGIMEFSRRDITHFVDMYMGCDQIAQAVGDSGLKALITRGITNIDGEYSRIMKDAREFIEKYKNSYDSRVQVGLGPHSAYTLSLSDLSRISDYALKNDLPLTMHLYETKKEYETINIEEIERTGILNTKIIIAHGTNVDEKIVEVFKRNNTNVSINVRSNMKLGNGFPPYKIYKDNNINITIGTDGSCSNNSLDVLRDANDYFLVSKAKDPSLIKVEDIYKILWKNVSDIGFLGNKILKRNNFADLIIIDTNNPWYHPFEPKKLFHNLILSGDSTDVFATMINGRWIYYNGEYKTVDIKEVYYNVKKVRDRIN